LKLPRDLSGIELARLLRKFGYEVTRQTGSHMRLTTTVMGPEHHITLPAHQSLKIGTLAQILASIAEYLQTSREELTQKLFG
jgi:predicted RNA binding protein YcfA (HicA-like mRNA interferase family)